MEIAPGVYSMSQEQGGHVHAFLLDDGQSLTLIDSLYDDDGNGVLAEVHRIGKKAQDIKTIILTHAHKSHIGGVAALKKASGATVCSHTWEVDIIAGRRKATRVSPIPQKPLQVYKLDGREAVDPAALNFDFVAWRPVVGGGSYAIAAEGGSLTNLTNPARDVYNNQKR